MNEALCFDYLLGNIRRRIPPHVLGTSKMLHHSDYFFSYHSWYLPCSSRLSTITILHTMMCHLSTLHAYNTPSRVNLVSKGPRARTVEEVVRVWKLGPWLGSHKIHKNVSSSKFGVKQNGSKRDDVLQSRCGDIYDGLPTPAPSPFALTWFV